MRRCHGLRVGLKGSRRFWVVFWLVGGFWGCLMQYYGFWKVSGGSEMFTDVLESFVAWSHGFWKSSRTFRLLLWHSGIIWGNLVHSERFLNVLRTFFDILESFEVFRNLLVGSESFRRLLNVLRCYQTFCDVLRHSEVLSSILSSSERFLIVLKRSLDFQVVFWCILRHACAVCGVFRGFPRISEAFSWVLIGSIRVLKVLRHSLMFWGVLRLNDLFRSFLMHSEWFRQVSECFEAFSDVLTFSEELGCILRGPELFWKVLERSAPFFDVLSFF